MSATVTNILNITSILVLLSLFGFGADQGEMHHCDRALLRCRTPCERKYFRRGAIIDPLLRGVVHFRLDPNAIFVRNVLPNMTGMQWAAMRRRWSAATQ